MTTPIDTHRAVPSTTGARGAPLRIPPLPLSHDPMLPCPPQQVLAELEVKCGNPAYYALFPQRDTEEDIFDFEDEEEDGEAPLRLFTGKHGAAGGAGYRLQIMRYYWVRRCVRACRAL